MLYLFFLISNLQSQVPNVLHQQSDPVNLKSLVLYLKIRYNATTKPFAKVHLEDT
jgi:hypothetical protein